DLEAGSDVFFDILTFYAGEDNTAPILARISGTDFGTPFPIQASSECVTLEFVSDATTTRSGFEINWECSNDCPPTSLDQITAIGNLPFSGSFSSCDVPASFAETACGTDIFLNGPEKVFSYTSPNDICASVTISNAEEDAGIVILNAPPNDPNARCIAENNGGFVKSVEFLANTTYYVVIAQPFNCVSFDIDVQETECINPPTLLNALCNPLNGCDQGVPGVLTFEDGSEDFDLRFIGIPIFFPSNSGCWLSAGIEPDYTWFTIEAQADGKFGFILSNPDTPSDIDFNVWGPFTSEEACNDKDAILEFISRNQPIRSSWAPDSQPTGLVDVHPIFNTPVEDEFDCSGILPIITPGEGGDNFVRTIDAQEGEVYIVLVNDFGDEIPDNRILVDWSPSDPEVLRRIPLEIDAEDQEICRGESTQLNLSESIEDIRWSPSESLSCETCFDPIATPDQTTTYLAIVEGFCLIDTVELTVKVFDLNPLEDITICLGEDFQVDAGSEFGEATYEWIAPAQVMLSCTDCPNPIITSDQPGTYTITVNLDEPSCPKTESFELTVLQQIAPSFDIIDDQSICEDEIPISIGATTNSDRFEYNWSSVPAGFSSNDPNPSVSPTETTTYFVDVSCGACPIVSSDSVTIEVFKNPVVEFLAAPTEAICQGDEIFLTESEPEEGVTYEWNGPADSFSDDMDLNTRIFPQQTGTYRFSASRGACETNESFDLIVTPIGINILSSINDIVQADLDTARLCLGEEIIFNADPNDTRPAGVTVNWTPKNSSLSDTIGMMVTAQPSVFTDYIATVENAECIRMDTVTVIVDSLPLSALPIVPQDTMICEGNFVILTSETYEPFLYPDIDFMWTPANGQQTPDSLYNMVANPDTTTTYLRETTNGACLSLDSVTVIVNPLPEVEIRPQNPALCAGESVQLETIILNEDEVTVESYMWEPMEGLSCADCPNPVASTGGNFTVTVMSDKMCPGSASVTVSIIDDSSLTLSPDLSICPGESVTLNNSTVPGATYTWESTDPNFTDINNSMPVVTPMMSATYSVTVTNENCPPVSGEVTITVFDNQPTELSIEPSQSGTICAGDEITLTAVSDGTGLFTWSGTNIVSTNENSATINPTSSTQYSVRLESECAVLDKSIDIDVKSSPEVALIEDQEFCLNESSILLASGIEIDSDADYMWESFALNVDVDSPADVRAVFDESGMFTFRLTASLDDCEANSDEVTINVIGPESSLNLITT
ncbi:MAG: CUB domain-containing protein, partial [Bacteroidota bacterium]